MRSLAAPYKLEDPIRIFLEFSIVKVHVFKAQLEIIKSVFFIVSLVCIAFAKRFPCIYLDGLQILTIIIMYVRRRRHFLNRSLEMLNYRLVESTFVGSGISKFAKRSKYLNINIF